MTTAPQISWPMTAASPVDLSSQLGGRLEGQLLWTLGPAGTDAEAEARRLGARVRLEPSFPEAMARASEQQGLALVAAGYLDRQNSDVGSAWVDLHFGYRHLMRLAGLWEAPTKTMAVAVRRSAGRDLAGIRTLALHPSTQAIVTPVLSPGVTFHYVNAKPLAVTMLTDGHVDACLGSLDVIEQHDDLMVVETFHPSMVWCLYAPISTTGSER